MRNLALALFLLLAPAAQAQVLVPLPKAWLEVQTAPVIYDNGYYYQRDGGEPNRYELRYCERTRTPEPMRGKPRYARYDHPFRWYWGP